MTDGIDPDEQEVTEADTVIQTASGERYRAAVISKSGERPRED